MPLRFSHMILSKIQSILDQNSIDFGILEHVFQDCDWSYGFWYSSWLRYSLSVEESHNSIMD